MSSDESSDLSSAPSDTESDLQLTKKDGLLKFFTKVIPKNEDDETSIKIIREPSPAHEYILADNQDIAFIVMFRSRFTEAFPRSLANFGPQELEQDIVQAIPGEGVESFLCALLGLLLNRKQDVKPGHYNRALEEAIQSHKSQWAKNWQNKTPLSKGATFSSMTPEQRLTLLRTLILWALSSSDVIKGIIQSSYKQQRQEDDLNQPLSVQPWGSDSYKRRYYLVEGLFDTQFRVYREGNYTGLQRTWYSVAGNIEELRALAERLQANDGCQKARLLSGKILAAIPRFEASEEKRKRKEYRSSRKQSFKRADPDYSMYEGRTRGKRIKYTFSDEEEEIFSDEHSTRRSMRSNGNNTVNDLSVPAVTQSGRHVKLRQGGVYGESLPSKLGVPTTSSNYSSNVSNFISNCDKAQKDGIASVYDSSIASRKDTYLEKINCDNGLTNEEGDESTLQDYNDEDEAYLESEVNASEEISDEYDDNLEDDPESSISKLPVQPPTSQRRAIIKLQLTPEKKAKENNGFLVTKEDDQKSFDVLPSTHVKKILCSTEVTTNFIKTNITTDSTPAKNITTPHSSLAC